MGLALGEEVAEDEDQEDRIKPVDNTPYEIQVEDVDIVSFLQKESQGALGKMLDAADEVASRDADNGSATNQAVVARSAPSVMRKISRAELEARAAEQQPASAKPAKPQAATAGPKMLTNGANGAEPTSDAEPKKKKKVIIL